MVRQKRKNMTLKNLTATIRHSLGRYIAILAIIALGAGFFSGLRITHSDMIQTLQVYIDRQGLFDLRLISGLGWTQDNVDAFACIPGLSHAEGIISVDALMEVEGTEKEAVYRLYNITQQVNQADLVYGRMPERSDECLADELFFGQKDIGRKIVLTSRNEESTMEALPDGGYTIVGIATSPLHLELNRGSSTIGNGSVSAFLYLPRESFSSHIYTEIGVLMEGDYTVYTEKYSDALDAMAEVLEQAAQPMLESRYHEVMKDALQEYRAGLARYWDGKYTFDREEEKVLQELEDALVKLQNGQKEIDENRELLEDGQKQLQEGWKTWEEGNAAITQSMKTLAQSKAAAYSQLAAANKELLENYKLVSSSLRQLEDGLSQMNSGITQIESALSQIESGLKQMDMLLSVMDASIQALETTLKVVDPDGTSDSEAVIQLRKSLEETTAQREAYETQREELLATQAQLQTQLETLKAQQQELQTQKKTLEDALDEINTGFMELQAAQAEADNQFAVASAQLDAGKAELEASKLTLEAKELELQQGLAALEEAQKELDQGWLDYESGKETAHQELENARSELEDAYTLLMEGEEAIYSLEVPEIYVLDRNTNTSYVSFEGSANILAGVAKIFPVFFLAVAALVCITTMTRMVYEERTQIGVLKALGYGTGSIVSKFMLYSGSAAVIGCVVGALLGGIVFPKVIWAAYGILYHFEPDIVLGFDLPLVASVTLVYTLVTLGATWYCCKKELQEVPAELMRPKAPSNGKKVLLEKTPLWRHLSFLNKVAVRNIFRYRQRFAMMLLGIGGCTALLLTAFGLDDSVSKIVDYQFENVALYDVGVTFSENQDKEAQEAFRSALSGSVQQTLFVHCASMDVQADEGSKNISMIVADGDISPFFSLHDGKTKLSTPREGEVLISIGTADALHLRIGDSVRLCSPDMQMLDLTVSGIFDNHIQGYAIVHTDSVVQQWGEAPSQQTAYLCTLEGVDERQLSTEISGMEDVANVSVNADLAQMVGGMMRALDGVILMVAICAALLAIIVLYNLTNINIQERIREIATIKVLGFHAGETAAYVFKENLVLTLMGIVVGLVGGIFLHRLVMAQLRLDMVWFAVRIEWISFVLAAVITLLASFLVDFVMYFKLGRINMAEALKSVE